MRPDTKFSGDDLRNVDPKFKPEHYAHYLQAVAALDSWAKSHYDRNVLALAVRWVLDRGPNIALWGARRPTQLEDVAKVGGWTLTESDLGELDAIVSRHVPTPISPSFMAPPL